MAERISFVARGKMQAREVLRASNAATSGLPRAKKADDQFLRGVNLILQPVKKKELHLRCEAVFSSGCGGVGPITMSHELKVLGPFAPFGLLAVPTPSSEDFAQNQAHYFLFESEASEHRLDASALGSSTRDGAYQSKIGLGADSVFAAVSAEEEILVSGKTVIWSSGGCVRKSFTLKYPIIQAILVNFDLGPSRMADSTDKQPYPSDLCVLHAGA